MTVQRIVLQVIPDFDTFKFNNQSFRVVAGIPGNLSISGGRGVAQKPRRRTGGNPRQPDRG
jgi:hypothetical protein